MNETELLDRIKVLEQENRVLQQTVDELQQKNQQNLSPFYILPTNYQSGPMTYINSDFWVKPADNFWNKPIQERILPNMPRFNHPFIVADDGFNYGYGTMVAVDSPEEDNVELRKKVSELKKKIDKLEKKLENLNSPLVHVVNAIKEEARYDSPSAAYQLLVKFDQIFKDCKQWNDNVKELKEFLLREKYRASLPPAPSEICPTDQQMADAISNICGKGKALDDKQKWMGVCCLVRAKYGYPFDIEACCKRLAALPYKEKLYKECDYGNVRKLAVYGFTREPYDKWQDYRPKDSERKYFDSCLYVANELEDSIKKVTDND